jgi:hypothetical protein
MSRRTPVNKNVQRWPPPLYKSRVVLHVPIKFAYRWCTDFSSKDPKLERVRYERRLLERSPKRRVFEDLHKMPAGWYWTRSVVTLRPPDGWHDYELGNHGAWSVDYKLRALGKDRTELTLVSRRRPVLLGTKNPTRARGDRAMTRTWREFGAAIERDYQSQRRRRS